MNSVIIDKIPAKISDKIDSVLWLEQNFALLSDTVQDLRDEVQDLTEENKKIKAILKALIDPKPTPSQKRAEKLRDKALKVGSIDTKKAKQILGLSFRKQALRAMRLAANTYPEDLYLSQYPDKTYRIKSRSEQAGHCPADLSRKKKI